MGTEDDGGAGPPGGAPDGPPDDDGAEDDAVAALSRLEQALERIGRHDYAARPVVLDDSDSLLEIAGRLDALIAQLRTALAQRPGED